MTDVRFGRSPVEWLFARGAAPEPNDEGDAAADEQTGPTAEQVAEDQRRRRKIVIDIGDGPAIHIARKIPEHIDPASSDAPEWDPTVHVDTPPAYRFLYDPPLGSVRYRVGWGGRGAGRSWQFARACLVHGMEQPLRILCAREWQNSIRDSVQAVLVDQIARLGIRDIYRVKESTITADNGTEFLFKGLRRDIGSIKSTEGVNLCWVEEGQSVSSRSWRELVPTIRADGSEIWVTFNTGDEQDATFQRLVAPTIEGNKLFDRKFDGIVRKTSFRDNPHLPEVLKRDEQHSLRTDPEEHAHVWDGDFWKRSKVQVLNGKWVEQEFTPKPYWDSPYYGVDWGFANDPTVLVKLWVADSRLWIEYAEGGIEMDDDATVAAFDLVPGSRNHLLRADAARPETIHAIRKRGFNIIGAPKWTGSVEDGIRHLRSYDQIVIHPRAQRAIANARLWKYKTRPGASGDPNAADAEILPILVDGNDDCFDAARYGLVELIRARPKVDDAPPSVSYNFGR